MRIFGSACNQRNFAVFDIFQKRLLLFFIKILNFVEIKQNSAGVTVDFIRNIAHVFQRRGGCVKLEKRPVRRVCANVRNGGFSRSRRAVENHIRDFSRF